MTVKDILKKLAQRCDGAVEKDNIGFNSADSGFGHSLANQEYDLTPAQERAALNLLQKYKKQLLEMGINLDDYRCKQKKVGNREERLEDVLQKVKWGKEKEIYTKDGLRLVREAQIPDGFWEWWSSSKEEIRSLGITLSKYKDKWKLNKWREREEVEKKYETYREVRLKHPNYLLQYQIDHVRKLIYSLENYGSVLDSSDTGTGKTYGSLAVCKELKLFPIVLCPKAVKSSFSKVMKEHFRMRGFVSNYEQFRNGKTEYLSVEKYETEGGKSKRRFNWNVPENAVLIFDEVHRCKNHDTLNAQMLIKAKESGIRVIAMSATIGSNPLHMYALGRVLELFHSSTGFFSWIRKKGCTNGIFGGFEFSGEREHLESIAKEIYPEKGARISIEKLGDLFPETLITADAYDLSSNTSKVNKIYREMEEELSKIRRGEKAAIQSKSILAIMQKARQKVEMLKVPVFVEMAQDAMEEGNSVAIFVNYNDTALALSEKLKTKNIIYGSNKGDEREQIIGRFQENRDNIIILNINAGGVGISLHDIEGGHQRIALISPDWSAEALLQALGRVHRSGGKTKSIQKIIFGAGTVEENICKVVQQKINNISTLNDGDLCKDLGLES